MRRSLPWPSGVPCWLDVMTPDPAATQQFYGELFGWQFRTLDDRYRVATLDGSAAAGVVVDDEHPSVWNLYLATDDVDAAVAAVRSAGGSVEIGARDAAGGRFCVAREPSGAVFCLWQAGRDIGCEIVNESGAFVWSELLSRDHRASTQFHEDVFGYGFWRISDAYTTIKVGDDVVGGIGELLDDYPDDAPPHWRIYFAAADTDAVVAQARDLGAGVFVAPHDTPFGRWAGLADPLGARFCVITPPSDQPG